MTLLKILIVHHGRLPAGGSPVAGVALRASAHGRGLAARGHEVLYATRARDLVGGDSPPGATVLGFEGRAELLSLARRSGADRVLAVAQDEMPALVEVGIPVVVDLFAPRILEAQFEAPDVAPEAARVLDAMALADGFLVTTERQRAYALGLLPLAGVDCREDRVAVVPLSAPTPAGRRARSREPALIAGGVRWPWQDPSWAQAVCADHLERRGRGSLSLFGGAYPLGEGQGDPGGEGEERPHPRIARRPLVGYDALLGEGLRAWAALDIMAPNPERSLALSFRQMDWLGCGLPILIGSYAPLAAEIEAAGAGWVIPHGDEPALRAALDELLEGGEGLTARSRAARALAGGPYGVGAAAQALEGLLLELAPRPRQATAWSSLSRDRDRLAQLRADHQRLGERSAALSADLAKKQAEVEALDGRVRGLLGTVGTLTGALEESLHLKRAELARLGAERDEGAAAAAAGERELALLRQDLEKKARALAAEADRRERIKEELTAAAARIHQLEAHLDAAERRGRELAEAARRADERRGELQAELEVAAADRIKKTEEVADLIDAKRRLKEGLEAELKVARADARGWEEIAAERARDLAKKDADIEALRREIDVREAGLAALTARLAEEGGALSARIGRSLARLSPWKR